MTRLRPIYTLNMVALVLVVLLSDLAAAQGRYAPVIRVNDKAITAYELQQRALMLRVLGAPGDPAREAREALIEERLQVQAAQDLGISVTEEGLRQGVENFAQRTNSDADTFLAALERAGVAEKSFLDFLEAGLLWREVVRVRFGPRTRVSEDEVDRAVALAGQTGGARVLVSEIVLPIQSAEEQAQAEALAADIAQTEGLDAFSAAARRYSASPSAARGGRLDWLLLSELPPALRTELLTLPPGGIAEPFRIPNAIAIFQLRALEELPLSQPEIVAIDYAELILPGATEDSARQVASEVDSCDDLYGLARALPSDRLVREARPPVDIPRDVAVELARLDEDEISTSIVRGNARVLLMLCGRSTQAAEELDRGAVLNQLSNIRATSYADAFLAELRADAVIIELE